MKLKSIYAVGLFMAAALGMSQAANAQLFVEPGITYEQGKGTINENSGLIGISGDMKGFGANIKAGTHFADIFFVGVDAQYSMPEFTSSNYNTKTKSLLGGVTAGLQTPYAGVRVWASYLPLGTLDQDRAQGLQVKFSEPDMYKLGAGLRVSNVSINLEYLTGKYKKSEVQNDGSNFATFDATDAKRESWMLGVSFPFAL